MEKVRTVTENLISVDVTGEFRDYENKTQIYSVEVILPDCDEAWLKSNIVSRYLFRTIKNGKEKKRLPDGKFEFVDNQNYLKIRQIVKFEADVDNRRVLDKKPYFYGKSLFDFTLTDLQDFAVAFGLKRVKSQGELRDIIESAFIEYIEKVLGKKKESFSCFRYDNKRGRYYLSLDNETRANFIIKERGLGLIDPELTEEEKKPEGTDNVLNALKDQQSKSLEKNKDKKNNNQNKNGDNDKKNVITNSDGSSEIEEII
jgi:hypothetical protein